LGVEKGSLKSNNGFQATFAKSSNNVGCTSFDMGDGIALSLYRGGRLTFFASPKIRTCIRHLHDGERAAVSTSREALGGLKAGFCFSGCLCFGFKR